MVKKGTPRYWGSSSYHPSGGRGTPVSPSESERMTRYWVSNWASMKSRCLVGATRTTSRCSDVTPLVVILVRQRMVSFENPFEAGACTRRPRAAPLPPASWSASARGQKRPLRGRVGRGRAWCGSLGTPRLSQGGRPASGLLVALDLPDGCVRSGNTDDVDRCLRQRAGAPPLTWPFRRADQVWSIVAHLEGPAGRL